MILIDLGLPGPLSWRPMTAGTVPSFKDTKIVNYQLYQLNVHKSVGIHPRVLKELEDVMTGLVSIIY